MRYMWSTYFPIDMQLAEVRLKRNMFFYVKRVIRVRIKGVTEYHDVFITGSDAFKSYTDYHGTREQFWSVTRCNKQYLTEHVNNRGIKKYLGAMMSVKNEDIIDADFVLIHNTGDTTNDLYWVPVDHNPNRIIPTRFPE